jgi:hypothetical protein
MLFICKFSLRRRIYAAVLIRFLYHKLPVKGFQQFLREPLTAPFHLSTPHHLPHPANGLITPHPSIFPELPAG